MFRGPVQLCTTRPSRGTAVGSFRAGADPAQERHWGYTQAGHRGPVACMHVMKDEDHLGPDLPLPCLRWNGHHRHVTHHCLFAMWRQRHHRARPSAPTSIAPLVDGAVSTLHWTRTPPSTKEQRSMCHVQGHRKGAGVTRFLSACPPLPAKHPRTWHTPCVCDASCMHRGRTRPHAECSAPLGHYTRSPAIAQRTQPGGASRLCHWRGMPYASAAAENMDAEAKGGSR
jgi:hypothetical protein